MATHIAIKGTYHDIGKQLGERCSSAVRLLLEDFKNSELYSKTKHYTGTPEGAQLLSTLRRTVDTWSANYLEELRGVAIGASVELDDLFLFNCEPEFVAVLSATPGDSHGVLYSSVYDGCTNISMETNDDQIYLAHTEDIAPVAKDLGIMLSVEIVDESGDIVEHWTDYYVPGLLPGSKFAFNHHGTIISTNNIYQKGINRNGIPRKFMCRSMLGVRGAADAVKILQQSPGIASAYSFHYIQKTDSTVENTVVEVAGTQTGSHVTVFKPRGYYQHCNMFQHLNYECHPEESSIHRAAVISQYMNRRQTQTKEHLISAISNQQDVKFPVHRNGNHPDYLATGSTGIFDVTDGTLEVYIDVPENSKPVHVFHIYET